MGTYTTKITDYGYKEKVSVYKQPITYDEVSNSVSRQKYQEMSLIKQKQSDERRLRYYKKTVVELIDVALMNKALNVAVTLTFKEPITSYDSAIAKWQLFLKRLRHSYKDLKSTPQMIFSK